jgi:hypothetical protein
MLDALDARLMMHDDACDALDASLGVGHGQESWPRPSALAMAKPLPCDLI